MKHCRYCTLTQTIRGIVHRAKHIYAQKITLKNIKEKSLLHTHSTHTFCNFVFNFIFAEIKNNLY